LEDKSSIGGQAFARGKFISRPSTSSGQAEPPFDPAIGWTQDKAVNAEDGNNNNPQGLKEFESGTHELMKNNNKNYIQQAVLKNKYRIILLFS